MWTEKNINSAASTYISNLIIPKEEVKYFIREAFLAGAKYVIDNTQKIK